jgi:hypothetical protein
LKISTANGTTWESIKAYVEKIKMCVICVQDHKITTQLGLDAASDWCCRNGGNRIAGDQAQAGLPCWFEIIWASLAPTTY